MDVYLDNAATTLPDKEVIDCMLSFWKQQTTNPSSTHALGRKARAALEQARKKIAAVLGCKEKELIFTSGGTEANNLILKSLALHQQIGHIISSPIEHHSVLDTLAWISKYTPVQVHYVNITRQGNINLSSLEKLLKTYSSALVSLMHANNEIGNWLDLASVGQLCQQYQALFHSDMVQSLMHTPLALHTLPIHFASGTAHKLHGPKGIGFIYAKAKLPTLVHGGSQERGLRGGTENISGIIGMAKAFELASAQQTEHSKHLLALKEHMLKLLAQQIPQATFNGLSAHVTESVPHILNIKLPGSYDNTLVFNLDMQGVYVSEGSACSSGALEGSHVLNELERGQASGNNLRISFSKYNTTQQIDYAVKILAETIG